MKVTAIILAAGKGKRMLHSLPKHFIRLEDKPVLAYTLDAFEKCPDVNQVLIVSRSGEEEYCLKEVVEMYGYKKVLKIVIGGERRQDSVYNGIKELDEDESLPKSAMIRVENRYNFKTPLNIVLAAYEPERKFIKGLVKEEPFLIDTKGGVVEVRVFDA